MEKLREAVAEATKAFKFPDNKTVSRVFYVPIGEDLLSIEEWFKEWFPLHNNILNKIYCWLPSEGGADFKSLIEEHWRNSMGAKTLSDIINNGYRLHDSSVDVFFLIDLTKTGSFEQLVKVKEVFDNIIDKWGSQLQVFFSCIAILRNYNEDSKEVLKPININSFSQWSSKNLNRLYTVDITNPSGTFISEPIDMRFFVGQLLYLLSKKPAELNPEGKKNNYSEWIGRIDASKGYASAFSAFSVLFPIDYVTDVCLTYRGAVLLEQTIFGQPNKERGLYYINSFSANLGLASYSSMKDRILTEVKKDSYIDPILAISNTVLDNKTKSFLEEVEFRLALYKKVNSAIPEFAQKNKLLLEKQEKEISGLFKYLLLDVTDQIITAEVGSEELYTQFINGLVDQINRIEVPDVVGSNKDVGDLLERIEKEKQKIPANTAVFVRIIILVSILFFSLVGAIMSFSLLMVGVSALVFIALLTVAYHWFAIRFRIRRLISKLEYALTVQWTQTMETLFGETVEAIKHSYTSNCDEFLSQSKRVFSRFRHIVCYGKDNYEPEKPAKSAFWINMVDSRSEALEYADLINDVKNIKPLQNLFEKSSLELWNRLCFSHSPELNLWEQELLSKAALEFLPESKRLFNHSVCETMSSNIKKLENISVLFGKYCEPFTQINTLELPTPFAGVFESPQINCNEVNDILNGAITQNFKTELSCSQTPYRISFFSFAEGIEFNTIVTKLNE